MWDRRHVRGMKEGEVRLAQCPIPFHWRPLDLLLLPSLRLSALWRSDEGVLLISRVRVLIQFPAAKLCV